MNSDQAIALAQLLVRDAEDDCGNYWNYGREAPKAHRKILKASKELLALLKERKGC